MVGNFKSVSLIIQNLGFLGISMRQMRRRLFIKYMDKNGEISERWISPTEVLGLADYIYLKAFCHTRNAERTFRLDQIVEVAVEVQKE